MELAQSLLMGTWVLAFFCLFQGIRFLIRDFAGVGSSFGFGRQQKSLVRVISSFREIEETLMAGLVPSPLNWERLKDLDDPWRTLSVDSLKELRDRGGSLLPTLRRL